MCSWCGGHEASCGGYLWDPPRNAPYTCTPSLPLYESRTQQSRDGDGVTTFVSRFNWRSDYSNSLKPPALPGSQAPKPSNLRDQRILHGQLHTGRGGDPIHDSTADVRSFPLCVSGDFSLMGEFCSDQYPEEFKGNYRHGIGL